MEEKLDKVNIFLKIKVTVKGEDFVPPILQHIFFFTPH